MTNLAPLVDRVIVASRNLTYEGSDQQIELQEAEYIAARAALKTAFASLGLRQSQVDKLMVAL